mgnify:CR=1 FL=1
MNSKSISLLERLVREKPTRENRLTQTLKAPTTDHEDDWSMSLPPAFNDALDIKQTERVEGGNKVTRWTQGSLFSFKPGDTIYDTPKAYGIWSEALKHLNLCVQVKDATSVSAGEANQGRTAGSVTFTILTPDNDRSQLVARGDHTLTQDDFVRFLIAGPDNELRMKSKKT